MKSLLRYSHDKKVSLFCLRLTKATEVSGTVDCRLEFNSSSRCLRAVDIFRALDELQGIE